MVPHCACIDHAVHQIETLDSDAQAALTVSQAILLVVSRGTTPYNSRLPSSDCGRIAPAMRVSVDQVTLVGSLICTAHGLQYEALLLRTVQVRGFAQISTKAAARRDEDFEDYIRDGMAVNRYFVERYEESMADRRASTEESSGEVGFGMCA